MSCDGNEITERLIDAVPDLWSEQQQADDGKVLQTSPTTKLRCSKYIDGSKM